MVSSILGPQSSNILSGIPTRQTTPSGSTASFTDQLAAALEGYLGNSANGSHLQIDIQTTQSQNSGVRQFLVTVKDPDSAPAATAPAASSPVNAAAPASASVKTDAPAPAINPAMSEVDAYWAAQPPEVQKLRDTQGLGERSALAQKLADQGFTVDRAIMVWGWDPMKTMLTRKMYGYNWVPSFNQACVPTPGMPVPGQASYDPNTCPPGAIAVNTDFANGLNIADPWA